MKIFANMRKMFDCLCDIISNNTLKSRWRFYEPLHPGTAEKHVEHPATIRVAFHGAT